MPEGWREMSTSGEATAMGVISVEDASDEASLPESRAAAATVFNKLVDSSAPDLVKELLMIW